MGTPLIDYLGLIMTPTANPAIGDIPIRGQSGGWTTLPVGSAAHGSVLTIDPTTGMPTWDLIPSSSLLPINVLPAPSGSAATDVANINAAVANGGIIVARSGIYLINTKTTIPATCGLVGQGSSGAGAGQAGCTTFRMTTAGAQLMIDGSGPRVGDFNVDGNSIANQPFAVGNAATTQGADRLFTGVIVGYAVQDNWVVKYLQNSSFVGCMSFQAGRDSIVFDGGCGALTFIGFNTEGYGRYGIHSQGLDLTGPGSGLYQVPSRIMFWGGLTEITGNNTTGTSALRIDQGQLFTLDNHDLSSPSPCASINTLNATLNHSTGHVLRDLGYSGNSALALSVDGNSGVRLDGGVIYTSFQGVHLAAGAKLEVIGRPDNIGFDATSSLSAMLAAVPPGDTDLGWTYVTLLHGWSNYVGAGGFPQASFRKDGQGFVKVRGMIAGGTITANTILFTLPAGYRPANHEKFPACSNGSYAEIIVWNSGDVAIQSGAQASDLSLNAIRFFAEN